MLTTLDILNPFGSARGRAPANRRGRARRPCVDRLEVRTLMASFQGIGANTGATAVSADGTVVVGGTDFGGITVGQTAFYWTQASGLVYLLNSLGHDVSGVANAVSGNGSIIVGSMPDGSGGIGSMAFEWANGVAAPLPQPAATAVSANSISQDGSIIAGDISTGNVGTGMNASGFTLTGTTIVTFPPSNLNLLTTGTIMSANGSVAAGNIEGGLGISTPYQWTNGALVSWPGSTSYSTVAKAISPDGSVVVGSMGVNGNGDTNPFEWTNGTVTSVTLPAGFVVGSAMGISSDLSSDGATIVGSMAPNASGQYAEGGTAFIWTRASGIQNLQHVLTADYNLGSSLAGWTLTEATAITPDGNTIVGNGTDPQGQQEGWIVNLAPIRTLQSITVTPASPSIPIGAAQQFTATGLFTDKSTENITSQVAWASATPSVATISATTGRASALAMGTSSITASLDGITGSTVLTVMTHTTPILQSITVTPADPQITVGAPEQFIATGSFSDNSTENLTSVVIWTSATQSVATISTTGLASALAMGTSSITASLDGITGSTVMTVMTHTTPRLRFQTKTLLTATPRSSSFGRLITLTATVKSRAGGVPAGSVNFLDEFGNILGLQVRLRDGKAILRTSVLRVGQDRIQADYIGNLYFAPSDSVPRIVTIRAHRSRTRATVSFAFPQSEHSITSKATVKGVVLRFGSSAGIATILDGSLALGTVLPDQAKASLTRGPSAEVRRVTPLSARYGDAHSSSSAPRKPTVNQSTTTPSRPPARLLIGD